MSTEDTQEISEWIISWIADTTNLSVDAIDVDELFVNFGLGSRESVMLAADLEDYLDIEIDNSVAWSYPSISKLSAYLSNIKKT